MSDIVIGGKQYKAESLKWETSGDNTPRHIYHGINCRCCIAPTSAYDDGNVIDVEAKETLLKIESGYDL